MPRQLVLLVVMVSVVVGASIAIAGSGSSTTAPTKGRGLLPAGPQLSIVNRDAPAVGDGWMLVYTKNHRYLDRVSTVDGKVSQRTKMPYQASTVLIDGPSLWIEGALNDPRDFYPRVFKVDAATSAVSAAVGMSGALATTPSVLAYGSLWVYVEFAPDKPTEIVRVDPASGKTLAEIPLSAHSGLLVASGGAIWFVGNSFSDSGTLIRVDPATNTAGAKRKLVLDGDVSAALGDDEAIWIATRTELVRVEPHTGRIVKRERVGDAMYSLALSQHDLWITNSRLAISDSRDSEGAGVGRDHNRLYSANPKTLTVVSEYTLPDQQSTATREPQAPVLISGAGQVWLLMDDTATRVAPPGKAPNQPIVIGPAPPTTTIPLPHGN